LVAGYRAALFSIGEGLRFHPARETALSSAIDGTVDYSPIKRPFSSHQRRAVTGLGTI